MNTGILKECIIIDEGMTMDFFIMLFLEFCLHKITACSIYLLNYIYKFSGQYFGFEFSIRTNSFFSFSARYLYTAWNNSK